MSAAGANFSVPNYGIVTQVVNQKTGLICNVIWQNSLNLGTIKL